MVGTDAAPNDTAAPRRVRNGAACPNCGATVRAPMWRLVLLRISVIVLAIVVGVASIFGMGRSAVGENTRGQAPRASYATTCKVCGAGVELSS